ncbi:MAG: iron-enterobactin ABC transporter permease [Bauldia sp.]|nr:iron-enterobactin ABC transporter permease [Bauldia sp.]
MAHTPAVDFGRAVRIVRIAGGRVAERIDLRTAAVCLIVLAFTAVVAVWTLMTGDFPVTPGEVLQALFGEASRRVEMVVVEWRLPRVLLAVVLGAALGMSGAIFQSVTRNPLGSPDVIGFEAGAYTGALCVIILWHGGYYEVATGALAGGILTAVVVYFLAYRQGVQGFRLIVVGIGVGAMLTALNTYLMLKAQLQVAMTAAIWGAGTLNGVGFDKLVPASIAIAGLMLVAVFLARPMRQLEMGDDAAGALGIRPERARLALIFLGIGFTATATAAAGPISFVALAAPQIARRLARSPGVALVPSACLGALLLAVADLAGQRTFAPTQLPVGVVTVSIGGLYFAWLLIREARRK